MTCQIKGPHLPVGDVDWECVRHEVNARLKEDVQAKVDAGFIDPGYEVRKTDFYCPVGRVIESLAEFGAVSEEQVEEIITAVLEEDRHEIRDFETGTHLHELITRLNFDEQRYMERFWELGSDRPVRTTGPSAPPIVQPRKDGKQPYYGGDTNRAIQGMRPQMVFVDEAQEIRPEDLIGAQVSLTIQGNVAQFVSKASQAAASASAAAATMKAMRKRTR